MEQLNRIELRGLVGSVRFQRFDDALVSHFTVATNYVYKDRAGEPVIETTWHNVTAWEGRALSGLERLSKGCKVQVIGRLKSQKYTDSDGVEHSSFEVAASKVQIIDDEEQMQYQMI